MSQEQLSFIIADLTRFTAEETLGLAMDIQANLGEDTPRDTGWARANWIMSIGTPLVDPQVPLVKGRPNPAQVASAQTRQRQTVGEVLGYTDISQGAIFTTNNVPYIGKLNEGWSRQAGAAFIQRSVGRALMEREARR